MSCSTEEIDRVTDGIRQALAYKFKYIDPQDATILHLIQIGIHGWVAVFGHPEHGSYEWVVQGDGEFRGGPLPPLRWSDVGYGCSALALRDGLNTALED